MRKSLALLLTLLTAFMPLLSTAQQPAPATDATPAIRVSTRVVLVDVLATKDGAPVSDLKAEDFSVEESGHKQKVAFFSLEQPSQQPQAQVLPPGVYSNKPEYNMPGGPLTVLLIDSLNTPVINQQEVRDSLIRYAASQVKPSQRVAIYGLTDHLVRLQDFTSDPQALRIAVERFGVHNAPGSPQPVSGSPQVSSALATITGLNGQVEQGALSAVQIATQGISDFRTGENSFNQQVRTGGTVQALRQLSGILAGYPGRKNLVWVASAFPFLLDPEDVSSTTLVEDRGPVTTSSAAPLPNENSDTAQRSLIANSFNEAIRKTTTMLSEAQVAIYPVDARGLFNISSTADASRSGLTASGLLQTGATYGGNVAASGSAAFSTQAVMSDLAQQTGGKVYMNRNDIDNAIALASQDGGVYYTLGYYPDKKKFDGSFRKIKVETSRPGVHLRYRAGYFAMDTTSKPDPKAPNAEINSAMHQGGNATMVYFDAQVVPPAQPANPSPVLVRFLVPGNSFTSEDDKGQHKVSLDFFVAVFDKDGKLLHAPRMTVNHSFPDDQFAQVKEKGLLMPMDPIDLAPADYTLRLLVRDNRTGYIGSVSAPLSLAKP